MTNRNRDYQPEEGQQTNENWDDAQTQSNQEERNNSSNETNKKGTSRSVADQTSSTGAGSSQRRDDGNVGPLDADLESLPSEKRIDRNNQTGPGLG